MSSFIADVARCNWKYYRRGLITNGAGQILHIFTKNRVVSHVINRADGTRQFRMMSPPLAACIRSVRRKADPCHSK